MHWAGRVVVLGFVVAAFVGLGIYYGGKVEAHQQYPGSTDIKSNYDEHVGELVFLTGTVTSVSPQSNEAQVQFNTARGSLRLRIRPFDVQVQPGGVVQVYGRLASDRTVVATNVAVVNPAGSSELYKYAISAVGALLILAQFFRHWRFNTGTPGFEVREDG